MLVGLFFLWLVSWGTGINFWVLLTVYSLVVVVWKFHKLQSFPMEDCSHCDKGRQYSSDGKSWRDCNWCGGMAYRVRTGARERSMGWARNRSGLSVNSSRPRDRLSRRADVAREPVGQE